MSRVRLSVDGPAEAEVALWQWLRTEPDLRGRVSREQASAETGAMGGATELVVAVASTGTLAAVARTVGVWLVHRRADIAVTLTLPDGRTVTLDAQRVQAEDVERLLHAAGESTIPAPPPDAPAPPAVAP